MTQEELSNLVRYDPATGHFFWIFAPRGRPRDISKPIGCRNTLGYIDICIAQRHYLGHRLAWLYIRGDPVPAEIDHINGNPSDNRIDNLRSATRSAQMGNSRGWKRTGTGLKGAYPNHGTWMAQIKIAGRLIYLGNFPTEQAAHEAYMRAAIEHFGEFANAGHHSPAQ